MANRKASLYWLYLRDYAVPAAILTLLFGYLTWLRGPAGFGVLIVLKLIATAALFWRHKNTKRREIYFYANNGLGLRELALVGMGTDLLVWVILSVLILQIAW